MVKEFSEKKYKAEKFPEGNFEEYLIADTIRFFPSIERLTITELQALDKRVDRLVDFHSKARLPHQAVQVIDKWASNEGFEKADIFDDSLPESDKYFFVDPWQGSSMILVKEGKRPITEGFRLVNAHADSPCLKIKQRPIRLEEMITHSLNYPGVRLSTIPHGGVVVPYWIGQPVDVMGYTIEQNGERREINFQGVVGVPSAHVDVSDWAPAYSFAPEKALEIITGDTGIPGLLARLKFERPDDFSNSQLWAVPINKMLRLGRNQLNLLAGYGHDDRTCVFSAVDAILNTKDPEYTSFVWVSDNEEIFEPPPAGTDGPFFEVLMGRMMERQEEARSKKISIAEKYKMYSNSKMIVGDVTVAPYGHDLDAIDTKSSAKLGLGVAISGNVEGNDPYFVRHLRKLASAHRPTKGIQHQPCGNFYSQDMMNMWCVHPGDNKRLSLRGVPSIWAGVPCASCHSAVEMICPGDESATSELYKRFFEAK